MFLLICPAKGFCQSQMSVSLNQFAEENVELLMCLIEKKDRVNLYQERKP